MFRPMTNQRRESIGYCCVEGMVILMWMAAVVVVNKVGRPVQRGYFCDDQSLMYPLLPDTVPNSIIVLLTLVTPPILMSAIEVVAFLFTPAPSPPSSPRSSAEGRGVRGGQGGRWGPVLAAYLAYFFGYLLMTLLVSVLKFSTGQLRPHFMAVCRPLPAAAAVVVDVDAGVTPATTTTTTSTASPSGCITTQYIVEYNCTNSGTKEKDTLILNARQSFPSGHAAYAAYLAVFMIMYIERRIVTRHLHLLKLTSHGLLTTYALWICATRVTDHKHHVGDVVVGALLGALLAPAMFLGAARRLCCLCSYHHHHHHDGGGTDRLDTDNIGNNVNHHSHNNNNRSDDEDDDVENGNLDPLEAETPTTPTPLLFNGILLSSNSGLRIGPLRLQGDKHTFPRRATLQ